MNKFYKPVSALSRLFYHSALNYQVLQIAGQRAFPERILLDMRQIEKIWRRSRDNDVLNKYLYNCYIQNSELVSYAVDMINFACHRNSVSQSLIYQMMQTLYNYIDENKVLVSLTIQQKIDVLSSLLKLKNYQIVQLVCSAFKFHEEPLVFKQFIKTLIEEHKFIEAAHVVSALHLQKEFDVEEVLIPLLLEGNVSASVTYMKNHPDIQLKVTKFLDGYLDTKNHIPTKNVSKPKKVFKTLSALLNVFRTPLGNCPNMQFIRSKGAINLLIKRRYEQSVTDASWEEMIKNIIQDNEDLKKHLIQKLLHNKDRKTAEKMSEIFSINISDLDCSEAISEIKETLAEINNSQHGNTRDTENFEVYDTSDEYLSFTLKIENIIVVDNKENFIDCLNNICQNYKMVGIDSEWKPHFGLSRDRLALIQLAVHDKVYIFDLLLLSECLDAEHWDRLLDDIFGNPNLIKLGCGIMSDINMILESVKGTKGKAVKFSHILDMVLFYEKLQDVYPVEMHSYSDKTFTRGLSSLCDIILGKPLNKEDRLCDWEKRPLKEKQLEYAALDAHCLLLMYDKLKEDSVKKQMNFRHLAKVAVVLTTSQWKPKRKYKGIKSNQEIHVQHSVSVEQLKIVMDSVFEKQGKELRKLGADVTILQNTNSAHIAIELSKKEGRIVICSEILYKEIKDKVKQGFCYYFQSYDDNAFQVTYFLQHFNAHISTNSIFSRCLSCNSNKGIKVSADDLKILHKLKDTHTSTNFVLRENLSSFSSELQIVLTDILNSDIAISILTENYSYSVYGCAFLCKSCGNIN